MVSRALAAARIHESILHTRQHFDANMSDVFFDELKIPRPSHYLGIGGGTRGQNTGRMIEAIEAVLLGSRPDWVLVYGDTDSTLAGTLAAVKLHIPVAHMEAGPRSFNRRMPEEINRVLTDHAASLLVAPTEVAVENLSNEGITGENVALEGDVMFDAALFYGAKADQVSGILERVGAASNDCVLATIHRAENTDDQRRLSAILDGFGACGRTVILPLHPRTRARLASFGVPLPANVRIIDPVGYLDMVMLEKHAALVATDSGGVQKEAFFHGVPCVTLRNETEWVDLLTAGWNRLVPPVAGPEIAAAIAEAIGSTGKDVQPYGAGNAATLIAARLGASEAE